MGFIKKFKKHYNLENGLTESQKMINGIILNKDGTRTVFVLCFLSHMRGKMLELAEKYEDTDVKEIRHWKGPESSAGYKDEDLIMIEAGDWYKLHPNSIDEWHKFKRNAQIQAPRKLGISTDDYFKEYYGKYEN